MVYRETGRYPLYIDSKIASIRYWLKLGKMPITRFPKQALIMLQNSLDPSLQRSPENLNGVFLLGDLLIDT